LDDYRAAELTVAEQDILWSPTFSAWDRWKCFVSSPLILFVYNGVITILCTVVFSGWFTSIRFDEGKSQSIPVFQIWALFTVTAGLDEKSGGSNSQISEVEYAIFVYCICSLVREVIEMDLDGIAYFGNFWNWIDDISFVAFM